MNTPIFIVGANRSGTTLLRLVLNAHPRIAIPEEIVYFGSTMAGAPIESWRSPPITRERYTAFIDDFVDVRSSPLGGIDGSRLKACILERPAMDFKYPYELVLKAWAVHHGKVRWGEKTPGNLFYADILWEMFPGARFVHVVRDPRAGVSSMMQADFFPDDVVFNAMSRRKFMTSGRDILEASVPATHRTLLRYEDLVLNPEETVRSLCAFLEEDFYPEMLSFYKDSSRYMKAEAAESFNKAATRPISADRLHKWKDKLTEADVARIEAVCGRQMQEFGYPSEGSRLRWNHRIELAVKEAYWNLQERRHRGIRHFTVKSPMFARLKGRMFRLWHIR